jgi:hypothetical protein
MCVGHGPLWRAQKIVRLILAKAVPTEVSRQATNLTVGCMKMEDDRLGRIEDFHQYAEFPVR